MASGGHLDRQLASWCVAHKRCNDKGSFLHLCWQDGKYSIDVQDGDQPSIVTPRLAELVQFYENNNKLTLKSGQICRLGQVRFLEPVSYELFYNLF